MHSTVDQFKLFHSNCNTLIDPTSCTQIWTFWPISMVSIKFQYFDQFYILHSSFTILIVSHFFTQISTFWLIPTVSINFKILIFMTFCTKISTFWQVPTFSLKFQHFDQFDILHSNSNFLINLNFFHSNCNILIDSTVCTQAQIWTFWLMSLVLIKFQYLDWFDILH